MTQPHAPQITPATSEPALPQLGFGPVRHTRLRPVHNAFAYAGYFLLLPMRAMQDPAHPASRTALACNRRAALSFFDKDHGDGRSPEQGGALSWLDGLLHDEGIDDAGGEVWLQCYPRVFGYAFKPVSFWFCHRHDDDDGGSLRAIVVEVNNTFGERHCYLLDTPRYGAELTADKVFHVSPFCAVTGRYRFRFMRTQSGGRERIVARVDHDDDQGPLIETSLSGTLEPINHATLRRALWRYPAMTLGVVARIHWHALRLWFKRVPFWRKPQAPAQTVTRQSHTPRAELTPAHSPAEPCTPPHPGAAQP